MPLTANQIIEEATCLPREQMAEVVDRLTLELHSGLEPQIEESWKQEIRRRLVELENGQVQALPGDIVSERIRKIVRR